MEREEGQGHSHEKRFRETVIPMGRSSEERSTDVICLNRSVLDFMESVLTPGSFVLEFGAGYSTPWFAERCGRIVSIETDHIWHQRAQDMAPDADVRHISDPKKGCWRQYARCESGEFDLILADGKDSLRRDFVLETWPMLKSGGWLIFDDAQRQQHEFIHSFKLGSPIRLEWSDGDIEGARDRLALAWLK